MIAATHELVVAASAVMREVVDLIERLHHLDGALPLEQEVDKQLAGLVGPRVAQASVGPGETVEHVALDEGIVASGRQSDS